MTQDDYHSHYTKTTHISGGIRDGWEFTCETCGYHARYYYGDSKTQYLLEIIDAGDPFTRHLGPNAAGAFLDLYSDANQPDERFGEPENDELDEDLFEEAAWLTPELRRKLGLILDRLGE